MRVWVQFHLTSLVVMDAFGHAVVVGWLFHEEKTAEALAHGFRAWLRAVAGVMPDFRPASFFSDDDPAEHKAIRCGLVGPCQQLFDFCSIQAPEHSSVVHGLCRLAFGEDMPVYLCIWHLLKAIKLKLGQLVRVRPQPLVASAHRKACSTWRNTM
jgi:hypothetical protein